MGMDFAPIYLVQRFIFRIGDFFHHWYVDGSRRFAALYIDQLRKVDVIFALAITIRYFFQPLYRDYSVIGRILGVVFRVGRILFGAFVYILITLFFALVYLVWLAIPAALLWFAVRGAIR